MPASLRTEIREFVDEVAGRIHPDEPLNKQIHHAIREGFDVIGICLNAEANVDELSQEAVAAAKELVGKMNLGPLAKSFAPMILQSAIPPVIEQLAGFTEGVDAFVEQEVLPRLDMWIDTLVDVRSDLAGKAEQ